MKSLGLSFKVTALVAVTTLIVLAIGSIFLTRLESQRAIRQMKQQATIVGDSIQRAVSHTLQGLKDRSGHHSQEVLLSLVQDLGKLDGVDHVEVFDRTLTIIAHSSPDRVGRKATEDAQVVTRVFETGRIIELEDSEGFTYERFIPISIPEGDTSRTVAVAEVVFSKRDVLASTSDFRKRLFALTIGITVPLSVLLGFFLRRIVTQRILTLAQMARRISQGDLRSRIQPDSSDEIGQLGRILNLMAGKLETARSHLEKRLEVQKEIDRLKDNFLAMVGHELRTPLTAVVGLSNAMLEGYTGNLNPKQKQFLQQIQDKGEHLALLINNILDLEKIQSGEIKLSLEKESLETLIDHSFSMVQIQAHKKGVRLQNHFHLELASMEVDKVKIQSIITNLLDNAIKFTPAGGAIQLSAQCVGDGLEPDYVEILVSDTGIGIPSEEQEKIFDRFYQVQQGPSREVSGVGLGLALARSFAMFHGGWLKHKVLPGWSTTFSLGLPLKAVLDSGRIPIQKSRFQLPALLNGIIRLLEEEHGKDLGVKVTWPARREAEEIEADHEYLRNILIHVLQNAIRYRNSGTVVTIRIGTVHDELHIVIQNVGPPFQAEALKKLADASRDGAIRLKPQYPSFSLQTAMAVLQAHGGEMEIENYTETEGATEKSGVRVTIRIPHRLTASAASGGHRNDQKENIDH
jgi:signal transduction histidine kinase